MFEARNGISGDTITAEEFEHARDRQSIALSLTCLGCGADAMFRRQSIDGRKATFWARHTDPQCSYASGGSGDTDYRALEDTEPRRPAEGVVKVRPAQRGATVGMGPRTEHDPDAPRLNRAHGRGTRFLETLRKWQYPPTASGRSCEGSSEIRPIEPAPNSSSFPVATGTTRTRFVVSVSAHSMSPVTTWRLAGVASTGVRSGGLQVRPAPTGSIQRAGTPSRCSCP